MRARGAFACPKPPLVRRDRWLTRRLGVGVLVGICASMAGAAAPAVSSAATLPPQGLYEACYPGAPGNSCVARLQRMGSGGFTVVMNYWMLAQSTPQDILNYVDAAQATGMKVIWPLNDWWTHDPNGNDLLSVYPALASSCNCSTNQGLLDYVVGLAKSRSSTWGYYIADEPSPSQHDQVKAFAASVQAADPSHPLLTVACGTCAAGDPTGSLAAPFVDTVSTVATDEYPVFTQAPDPTYAYNYVAAGMKGLQTVDDHAARDSGVVLQAFDWSDGQTESQQCHPAPTSCRFPTEQEMEMMRNAALLNGRPQVILWFGLFDIIGYDPTQQPSYWQVPADPTQRWSDLVQAAFAPNVAAPPAPPASAPSDPTASTTVRESARPRSIVKLSAAAFKGRRGKSKTRRGRPRAHRSKSQKRHARAHHAKRRLHG